MKVFKYLFFFTLAALLLYCGFWLYMAQTINAEVNQFYDIDGPESGYEFYGDKPKLSGFPFTPVLSYDKGFSHGDTSIKFDTLTIETFPIFSRLVTLTINDIAIQSTSTQQLFEIDEFKTTLITPDYFPEELTQRQVSLWQKNVGAIDFKKIAINKNNMLIEASGPIGLDSNLQPSLNLNTKITDYDKLIHFMSAETSELSPFAASLALTVLNGMATTDETTGRKFVQLDIQIKNRKLIAGPIQTITIPKVTWPDKL